MIDSFISYEGLPIKSGGAHIISRLSVDETYLKVTNFLHKFTDTTTPTDVRLTIYQSPTDDYDLKSLLWLTRKKFGLFPKKKEGFINLKPINYWEWKLRASEFSSGLEYVKNNNFKVDQTLGPIEISFLWTFKFKSPKTGKLFPNQEEIPELDVRQSNSQIYLKLSNRKTISTWFAFPFTEVDEFFINLIAEMQKELPFRFSEQHWRNWRKSKNNNWTPRKISVTTL
jgi:hypothetical protein